MRREAFQFRLDELAQGSIQRNSLGFQLPYDHAHKHGSVAPQVSSGMSGAIIVSGGLDSVKEIAAAKERVFVLQQIPYVNRRTIMINGQPVEETFPEGIAEGEDCRARGVKRERAWSYDLGDGRLNRIGGARS